MSRLQPHAQVEMRQDKIKANPRLVSIESSF